MVGVHVFFCEVVDYLSWFCCGEKRGAGTVAEEAQIAVVCHDMDRCVECNLAGGVATGANVVHGADVAAIEAEAGPQVKHAFVGWVGICEGEWVRFGNGFANAEGWEFVIQIIDGEGQRPAGNGAGPFVMHACESDFGA